MKYHPGILFIVVLLLGSAPLYAQEESAIVDTTFVSEDGTLLRYRGEVGFAQKPGGIERFMDREDDRVPLGYGWKSVTGWKENDPRSKPIVSEGRVITEIVDLHYDPSLNPYLAMNFAEYGDYIYFPIKDRLGWTIDEPIQIVAPLNIEEYGQRYSLPWWIPCEVKGDTIVVEAISTITSRGIAIESMTRSYVEMQIRRKTGDRVPYWLIYGVGATLGDEGWILKGQVDVLKPEQWDLEIDHATMIRDLEIFRDSELMMKEVEAPGSLEKERTLSRIAFWRAFQLGQNIILKEGLGTFKDLIAAMEADASLSFEDGVQRIYGKSVAELVSEHSP